MAKQQIIKVQDTEVTLITHNETDYISITDIARKFNEKTDIVMQTWMRNMGTIEYLGLWEELHNINFNALNYQEIKSKTGSNSYYISLTQWIKETNAIGLRSSAGRYGGTFAHKDIAIQFCYWLSPTFQLYLIKEFQSLKEIETKEKKEALDWNIKRTLAKVNYSIHTDAVKNYLMPTKIQDTKFESVYYATEADVLNLSLFGYTAKEWHDSNPQVKGNLRDNATTEQLLVLANLENLNAEFIKMGFSKQQRLTKLNDIAIYQMRLLVNKTNLGFLKSGEDKTQFLLDNNE
jgi:KilA-N domain